MSLARIYTTKKVRKDWKCGKCGAEIRKGIDGRISFAVGFRGYEQTRCMKSECYPTRSERESSMIGQVYDAQDSIDFSLLTTADDFTEARDSVVEAIREVASEYESNEMYDINEDLQERVSMLEGAADELENWEPENEEPTEDEDRFQPTECNECDGTGEVTDEEAGVFGDCDECGGTGEVDPEEEYSTALDAWQTETRESFESAVNDLELP